MTNFSIHMLSRRFYSDSAKARQLLKNAFERMQKPGYVKSDAQRDEIVKAAKELDITPDVAVQAYASTALPQQAAKGADNDRAARRRAATQADIEMFGPSQTQQFTSRDFQYDDLPSAGHLQLEEHRDAREFLRAASYELPLLAQYRSPYTPPNREKLNLRFQHFAFPNEPSHPAMAKVVLTFSPDTVGLSAEQLHKLKLLAGSRFDSNTNTVRISASRFPTQAQNKRYLVQTYERLVAMAKDGTDSFADVPLDERLARKRLAKKKDPKFHWPKEWSRPDLAPQAKEDIYTVLGNVHN